MVYKELDMSAYIGCRCVPYSENDKKFNKYLQEHIITAKEEFEAWLKHIKSMFRKWTTKKYPDFSAIYTNKDEMVLMSKLRGIAFIYKDYGFDLKYHECVLKDRLNKLYSIIDKVDESYVIDNEKSINSDDYMFLVSNVYNELYETEEHKKLVMSKQQAKYEAKKNVQFRYRIGDKYMIAKSLSGIPEVYEVKKFIYTVGETIINTVVMKLLYGKPIMKSTLSRIDCKAFHIRYETGLYAFNMNHQFRKITDEEFESIADGDYDSVISGKLNVKRKQEEAKSKGLVLHKVELDSLMTEKS